MWRNIRSHKPAAGNPDVRLLLPRKAQGRAPKLGALAPTKPRPVIAGAGPMGAGPWGGDERSGFLCRIPLLPPTFTPYLRAIFSIRASSPWPRKADPVSDTSCILAEVLPRFGRKRPIATVLMTPEVGEVSAIGGLRRLGPDKKGRAGPEKNHLGRADLRSRHMEPWIDRQTCARECRETPSPRPVIAWTSWRVGSVDLKMDIISGNRGNLSCSWVEPSPQVGAAQ